MFQILKILFQTGDSNNRGVIHVLHFQIKSIFSKKKINHVQSETHFCKEALKVENDKVVKENPIAGRIWSSV